MKIITTILVFLFFFSTYPAIAVQGNRPATNSSVINYARNLLLTIVDSNFRGSWVIDPSEWERSAGIQKIQRSFNSLANIKIGSSQRDVKKSIDEPQETRNNGKIWIYGTKLSDGTYSGLLEVFFDDKLQHITGIISFNPKNIPQNVGVNIGDSIDKMISVYGEPVDEKDFIEDPDNKDYLGLYYLYPRSGIGFLIGQDKPSKDLLVHGIIVFGKQ